MIKFKTACLIILTLFGFQGTASANSVGSIYMVTIHTDNFEEMKFFYHKTMGLNIVFENEEFIEFASEGLRLSLASYQALSFLASDSLRVKRKGSGLGVGFKYDSKDAVDIAYQELLDKGATAVNAPAAQPWGGYTAFFSDPDGNVHELVSDIKK
jgi:uncharacterized glyoxalase superfamily protein PhnB